MSWITRNKFEIGLVGAATTILVGLLIASILDRPAAVTYPAPQRIEIGEATPDEEPEGLELVKVQSADATNSEQEEIWEEKTTGCRYHRAADGSALVQLLDESGAPVCTPSNS